MSKKWLEGERLVQLIRKAEEGDFLRAAGECLCPVCSAEYRDHPYWSEAPTFHLLCTGLVVKT